MVVVMVAVVVADGVFVCVGGLCLGSDRVFRHWLVAVRARFGRGGVIGMSKSKGRGV